MSVEPVKLSGNTSQSRESKRLWPNKLILLDAFRILFQYKNVSELYFGFPVGTCWLVDVDADLQ